MKTAVCIFAHPDDEAFGPSGTIAKLSRDYDIYLLCATRGEAGIGEEEKLAEIRSKELEKSAEILGIKKVYFLGFEDGTLSNSLYHKLAFKIQEKLEELKPELLITFEPRGVSGHIDHITVSMATSFVFTKLKFIKKLLYTCITENMRSEFGDDYFIFFPPGYKKEEIHETVDVSDVWEQKTKAMMTHKSQMQDIKRILKRRENQPKEEYFLIKENK